MWILWRTIEIIDKNSKLLETATLLCGSYFWKNFLLVFDAHFIQLLQERPLWWREFSFAFPVWNVLLWISNVSWSSKPFQRGDKTKSHFENQILVVIQRFEVHNNVFHWLQTIDNLSAVLSFCFPALLWKLMPRLKWNDITKHQHRCTHQIQHRLPQALLPSCIISCEYQL